MGGIVGGFYKGTISDCYNLGIVYGQNSVGGVFGLMHSSNAKVARTYCKAPKNGLTSNTYGVDAEESYCGGLGGYRQNSLELEDNYWWSPCSDIALGWLPLVLEGNGFTYYHYESRFTDTQNFDNWNFDDVWQITTTSPKLRMESKLQYSEPQLSKQVIGQEVNCPNGGFGCSKRTYHIVDQKVDDKS